jgi:hypothetical protein
MRSDCKRGYSGARGQAGNGRLVVRASQPGERIPASRSISVGQFFDRARIRLEWRWDDVTSGSGCNFQLEKGNRSFALILLILSGCPLEPEDLRNLPEVHSKAI